MTKMRGIFIAMLASAAISLFGATNGSWNRTAGGDFADATLWKNETMPSSDGTASVFYQQSAPITLTSDLTLNKLEFYYFHGEFAFGNKTLSVPNGGQLAYNGAVGEGLSDVRITSGTFAYTNYYLYKGTIVVDGQTAVFDGYGMVGVGNPNCRLEILNGALGRGGFQIGRNRAGSNTVMRVSGAGSRFVVPSIHNKQLLLGVGGGSNSLEVVDGAVFENLSEKTLRMDDDIGWSSTVDGYNVLRVSNATFSNVNSTVEVGYYAGHDKAIFNGGAKVYTKNIMLGCYRKSAEQGILGNNVLDVSGAGTVLENVGTVHVGNSNSNGNLFNLSEGAEAATLYVQVGNYASATSNDVRISSGGILRVHGTEIGKSSVGNRLVLENGSFIGTRSELRPAGEYDYIVFGRNVSGDAELVFKGTNSYFSSSHVLMDSLSRVSIEIPDGGLVGGRPLFDVKTALIGDAAVAIHVSEDFHAGGRYTLMKWTSGADAAAMFNNGQITLTGHRASLIVSEHQIDVKIPSDRGFVITFR